MTIYLICFFSLLLNFSGYILLLALIKKLRPRPLTSKARAIEDPSLPAVTIIVPVYNEEKLIRRKLENLFTLRYPKNKLRILVVDGQSSDKTPEIIGRVQSEHVDYQIDFLVATVKGKTGQLNEAFHSVPAGHLVVITDSDTTIETPDALLLTLGYFEENENVGLVGGWAMPPNTPDVLPADHAYWDKQNRMRYMETLSFSSSIVVAPYYAFYKHVLDNFSFPDECVADDVYISFVYHLKGKRVVYATDIDVTEHRQPSSLREMFSHKLRKSHAYSVELLRVFYKLPQMGRRLKGFYVFKVFQFFYLPWACVGFGLSTLQLAYLGYWNFLFVTYGGFLLALLLTSSSMVPPPNRRRGGASLRTAVSSGMLFALMIVVLILNLFLYPFWNQNSVYTKVSRRYR